MGIFWKNKTTRVFIDVTGDSESFSSPISSNELANNPNGYIFKIKSSDGIEFISNYSFKENDDNIEVTMYGSSSNYKLVNKTITVEDGGSGGGSGGVTIVNVSVDGSTYTFDKKWSEVTTAFKNGVVLVHIPDDTYYQEIYHSVAKIYINDSSYYVYLSNDSDNPYTCSGENEYPVLSYS